MTTAHAGIPTTPTTEELVYRARAAVQRCGVNPHNLTADAESITASSPLTGEALFDVPASRSADVVSARQRVSAELSWKEAPGVSFGRAQAFARPPPRNRALSGRPADVAFPAAERRRGGPAGTVASYHLPGQPARPTTAGTVGPISVPRPGSRCAHRSLYRTDEITDS